MTTVQVLCRNWSDTITRLKYHKETFKFNIHNLVEVGGDDDFDDTWVNVDEPELKYMSIPKDINPKLLTTTMSINTMKLLLMKLESSHITI